MGEKKRVNMQRGNRHAAIALAVEIEFPLAFHA
ncbi:hypothetical protein Tco_1341616, partial [Tanacetum coccineum]